jgi:hypothetical protein
MADHEPRKNTAKRRFSQERPCLREADSIYVDGNVHVLTRTSALRRERRSFRLSTRRGREMVRPCKAAILLHIGRVLERIRNSNADSVNLLGNLRGTKERTKVFRSVLYEYQLTQDRTA